MLLTHCIHVVVMVLTTGESSYLTLIFSILLGLSVTNIVSFLSLFHNCGNVRIRNHRHTTPDCDNHYDDRIVM